MRSQGLAGLCLALCNFRPASQRSLFSQLEPQTSKGGAHLKDCCQNCGERFPGGPALAQEAGWWRVGPREVVVSQNTPPEGPAAHTGQPGRPRGERTFCASQLVPGEPAKARYDLASEEVAKRAPNSLRHFCDIGDLKSQEKENWAGSINLWL